MKIVTKYGVYDGEVLNGKFHGNGTYIFNNGDKYTGEWKNGMIDGKGVYQYAGGAVYTGEWLNHKKTRSRYNEICKWRCV